MSHIQPAQPLPELDPDELVRVLCRCGIGGCVRIATEAGVKSCCRRVIVTCASCRVSVHHTLTVWWPQQYGSRPPCRCGGTTDDIAWRPL